MTSVAAGASIPTTRTPGLRAWFVGLLLLACLVWSYWSTLAELFSFWLNNDDYSVGLLVPVVVAYLAWRSRERWRNEPAGAGWWGLGLLGLAQIVRFAGLYYAYGSLERFSLVLTIAGVLLLAAGGRVFWKARWLLVFLLLMLPPPARVHEALLLPLQRVATAAAAFGLETLGYFVVRHGNVLLLEDRYTVAVAEACSGLRMMSAFVFVMAVLVAITERPVAHKLVLLLASVPLAVFVNVVRIAATAILVERTGDPGIEAQVHDAAGWLMMPVAVVLALALLRLLGALWPPANAPRGERLPARATQGSDTRATH